MARKGIANGLFLEDLRHGEPLWLRRPFLWAHSGASKELLLILPEGGGASADRLPPSLAVYSIKIPRMDSSGSGLSFADDQEVFNVGVPGRTKMNPRPFRLAMGGIRYTDVFRVSSEPLKVSLTALESKFSTASWPRYIDENSKLPHRAFLVAEVRELCGKKERISADLYIRQQGDSLHLFHRGCRPLGDWLSLLGSTPRDWAAQPPPLDLGGVLLNFPSGNLKKLAQTWGKWDEFPHSGDRYHQAHEPWLSYDKNTRLAWDCMVALQASAMGIRKKWVGEGLGKLQRYGLDSEGRPTAIASKVLSMINTPGAQLFGIEGRDVDLDDLHTAAERLFGWLEACRTLPAAAHASEPDGAGPEGA